MGDASTVQLVRRLWKDYLSRYWPRLAFSLVAMAVYAASYGAIPIGVEWINSAFSGGENRFSASPRDILVYGPFLIFGVAVLVAGSMYLQMRLSMGAALSALRDMQRDMFQALTAFDYAQVRREASGQTISRFTNDPMVLRDTLTRVSRALRDLLTLLALLSLMIYYDWLLFLIVIMAYAIAAWPISSIGGYLRRKSRETQNQAGDVASLVNETVAGAAVVRTFQLEDYEQKRGGRAFDKRLGLLKTLNYTRALNEPVIFVIGALAVSGVVAAGAWRVMLGALDGAQFGAFIVTLIMLSQPARSLSTLNAVMQEGFGAFERMLSIIDLTPQVKDRKGAKALVVQVGAVSFRDVTFAYEPGAAALNGFSLDIPAGQTVALVGESGAGKSTVFNLLPRLYDIDEGNITIDGQKITGATLSSLRQSLALVSQGAYLFNDTVRANIAAGRLDASGGEIVKAAKAAAAHDFIVELPDGYEAYVGEGGGKLSGGQRQRIALARAFLKDAPVLMLDEATSALDAESEAKVQHALENLSAGRTTIVIAHRLSTVRNADLIAVMDAGRVVETGTHDELMKKNSAYARLVELQLAGSEQAAE